jgi:hypothetical protein
LVAHVGGELGGVVGVHQLMALAVLTVNGRTESLTLVSCTRTVSVIGLDCCPLLSTGVAIPLSPVNLMCWAVALATREPPWENFRP